MRRRSLFRWTTLTVIGILAVLTILRLAHSDIATAAGDNSGPQSQGSIQILDKDGKLSGEVPLKHTSVKAQVSGFISRVTVTQDFENNFTHKIEAVYTFPLPQAAAVDDLTMLIGERTIKGKIMRRNEAQAAYNDARQQGKTATLLDQERPNIFTQQIANIMPGQQIRIIISYVETLKYENGSYEWTFPMVVGPRYMPDTSSQPNAQELHHSPARARNDMRGGHDISLELDLDAGVPIFEVSSLTHETEIQQLNDRHAVVRLKDRVTIPNKDFVLTYRVAGDSINDAVLAHRSERGGFFTLILQPPQRVAPEDVMPKELVFVLDTSGSMTGFPFEKAKQTMDLALKNLYPHDTFNLITFSGDTSILFPEPVPATPENLQKAKNFLDSHTSNGGTEMMKAIKAALELSDSQYHVRIVCFMTDGQVGNDNEILSEVKKHPNARVFAMGFGDYPNRYLLDKMAEYGRGEVDYVLQAGEASEAARRFHERIRNPLLTDISVEWEGLAISEVYPRSIPDLFSVKPVTLSGRYASGGEGTIRLKGKMAGQDFVREIPVKLPETEADHDVLATLWARRKVADLMDQELAEKLENKPLNEQPWQEQITQLGLTFNLMTQYTSFVAIDDLSSTGGDTPRRVDVSGNVVGISECVTVVGTSMEVQCSLSPTITLYKLPELPLQGRSFTSLVRVTTGAGADQPRNSLYNVDLAVNGHRSSANNFMIDGVSAESGIAAGGESPGTSASGNAPALTASGGTNGIASFDATEEINIQTTAMKPENGSFAGAQIKLTTKAGTNEFHGSVFHFFGNDVFDANDWFANSRGLDQPPKRLNLFGGTFGGPIKRDHTFFFAAYEGLRLRQPLAVITDVPSLTSRAAAPAGSFLNAFPLPTGVGRADGFSEFAASFANPARHDVGSLRVEHNFANDKVLGRYSFADSEASERGANGLSLNTTNRIRTRAQAFTGTLNHMFSPVMLMDLHVNYSRSTVSGAYLLDDFGGAVVPDNLSPSSFTFDLSSRNAAFMRGDETASVQRQFNFVGVVQRVAGTHDLKFGADYRRLSPIIGQRPVEENVLFAGIGQLSRISVVNHDTPQEPVFNRLSLFGQEQWKLSPRVTLVYGTRWDLAPAPSSSGQALWKTSFGNFAPRASVAYQLDHNADTVLRGSVGVVYDVSQDASGNFFANSIPFVSGDSALPFISFDPKLKLPYAIDWTVSLERAFGANQLSAAYIGSSGNRLLHTETLFNQHPDFSFLRLVTNRGHSDYRALQLKFERRFSNDLAANVSYVWSQSLDNVTEDSERRVIMASANPELDRGPSDFDFRHQLTGYISYALPAPIAHGLGNKLLRNWSVDSVFNVRSARPLNVVYMFPTSYGVAYLRPDVVSGTSFYIFDSNAPGGRRLNWAAFLIPSTLEQGSLARNSLRGFPFYQIDLGVGRKFNFSENVGLRFQADAFNLFNHANFEDPLGNDLVTGGSLAFGQSTSMSGRSLYGGGFGSFYSFGGARTMRFSVKLLF